MVTSGLLQYFQYQIHQTNIKTYLDISMLILIIFASYTLIFTQAEFSAIIIFIMFAYLVYFIKLRYNVYFSRKKAVIGQIKLKDPQTPQQITQLNQTNKNNQSVFIQQYRDRRSQRQSISEQQKSASFSILNRSRRADDLNNSFQQKQKSRSILSQNSKKNESNDFSFLKVKNKPLSSDSFIRNQNKINQSYIRGYYIQQKNQQQASSTLLKLRQQCQIRYVKTLKKLNITQQQSIKVTDRIKRFSLQLVKQIQKQNIDNFQQIISTIEQLYQIKITYRNNNQIQNMIANNFHKTNSNFNSNFNYSSHHNNNNNNNYNYNSKKQVSFEQCLKKLLKTKTWKLDYPQRKITDIKKQNIFTNSYSYFGARRDQDIEQILQPIRKKLLNLIQQRQKLNIIFFTQQNSNITSQYLLNKLQMINQYIYQCQNQQSQYQIYNPIKITQQQSQLSVLIFNLIRNKLNTIIGQYKYTLQYSKILFLGWFKNQDHQYLIKQTLNSDYGHPHYDLLVTVKNNDKDKDNKNKSIKQQYNCQFGIRNFYSIFMMYLEVLLAREIVFVRKNRVLVDVMRKCLGVTIL